MTSHKSQIPKYSSPFPRPLRLWWHIILISMSCIPGENQLDHPSWTNNSWDCAIFTYIHQMMNREQLSINLQRIYSLHDILWYQKQNIIFLQHFISWKTLFILLYPCMQIKLLCFKSIAFVCILMAVPFFLLLLLFNVCWWCFWCVIFNEILQFPNAGASII